MGRRGRERAEASFSHAALSDRVAAVVAALPRTAVAADA
jgi:hypothetical protein